MSRAIVFVDANSFYHVVKDVGFFLNKKNYKLVGSCFFTHSDMRFMLPGDLRVARCFSFFGGFRR